ncbi:MAG TPA: lactonase family protein [Candidatus Acidoferrum sp.]|nr:lactonase family protein [Candidatus Acidoferrum sp.]
MKSLRLLLAFSWLTASAFAASAPAEYWTFFGTYTGAKSKGIYAAKFNSITGKFGTPHLAAEITNPSFLAVHPNAKWLYAIGEVGDYGGKKTGSIAAYAINATSGKLVALNSQTSGGAGPCHVFVDQTGKCVLAANYGGGSLTSVPLKEDGSLGEPGSFIQHTGSSVNKSRQEGPHGHCIVADPSNRFALACDLGLDQVLIYKLDPEKDTLTPNDPAFGSTPPGAGPRHLAFHPNGKFVYVINEINCTMTTFSWDGARGALSAIETVTTLPGERQRGHTTAEVQVHPSGKFVYGSNRGHDTIVVFKVDQTTGKLTRIQNESTQGKTPRHFTLDPTGRFLIAENQDSHDAFVFSVDQNSGRITATGEKIEIGAPVCAVFVPAK